MNNKFNCIMLIDDNSDDNFFHEREIKKADSSIIVINRNSGKKALEYLIAKEMPLSDLIFLDINMPGMNGWEFLKEYSQLDKELQRHPIIIMLSTSDNVDDLEKAKAWSIVSEYRIKPLTRAMIEDIAGKYFK